MRYRKSIIITICLMAIAFASISTTFIIRGNTKIGINEDDFNVYFSDARVNGVQDLSIVVSERKLSFVTTMKSKNETYVVDYDVTNGSKNYDAALQMTCTGGNEYLSVNNVFDTNTNLLVSETRSGKLTLVLDKQYTGDSLETEINCTITATGVERTELDTGIPAIPVDSIPKWIYTDSDNSGTITEGDLYVLATNENEKFNVISQTDDTITMLTQYNLGDDDRQSQSSNYDAFSCNGSWSYKPGPKEIDKTQLPSWVKKSLSEYEFYLKSETKDITISTNLITLAELKTLGCTINDDYSNGTGLTCVNSEHADWLINGQRYWTRSASSSYDGDVWYVGTDGTLNAHESCHPATQSSYRPVITISKDAL